MEQKELTAQEKELYNDKRFPKIFQSMAGAASMMYVGIAFVTAFSLIIRFIGGPKSEFGTGMLNSIISQIFMVLIIPLFIVFVFKKDARATFRLNKGIDAVQMLLLLGMSIGVFFAAQVANSLFVNILTAILGEPKELGTVDQAENISQLLFQIVITAGLPAICEELFFRGMVMRSYERISPVAAVILSSIVFSVMHGNFQQIVYALIMGAVFATVTITADSLIASVEMHFLMNTFSCLLMYKPINDEYVSFFEQQQTISTLLVLWVLPALFIVCFMAYIMYTRKRNNRLYGKKFVSDIEHPEMMPKPKSYEKPLTAVFWVIFALTNFFNMIANWFITV